MALRFSPMVRTTSKRSMISLLLTLPLLESSEFLLSLLLLLLLLLPELCTTKMATARKTRDATSAVPNVPLNAAQRRGLTSLTFVLNCLAIDLCWSKRFQFAGNEYNTSPSSVTSKTAPRKNFGK